MFGAFFIAPNASAKTSAEKDAQKISHLRKTAFGTEASDGMIFTNRETFEDDFKKDSLCCTYDRIGNDIVAFVAKNGPNYPRVIEMTSSDVFTAEELAKFPSSTLIPFIPVRNSSQFKYLTTKGRRAGFHIPDTEISN
jgi:hypothetical protein